MDNQQERSLVDLGWLAGVWESEGYFGMRLCSTLARPKYSYANGFRLDPLCGFTNSDPKMIEELSTILRFYGLAFYTERPRIHGFSNKKPTQEIKISGLKRTIRILNFILPYLKTKRKRALLLKKYIDHRLSKFKNSLCGIYELYLYDELRKLNGNPPSKSSESIRQTLLSQKSDDVLRTE